MNGFVMIPQISLFVHVIVIPRNSWLVDLISDLAPAAVSVVVLVFSEMCNVLNEWCWLYFLFNIFPFTLLHFQLLERNGEHELVHQYLITIASIPRVRIIPSCSAMFASCL